MRIDGSYGTRMIRLKHKHVFRQFIYRFLIQVRFDSSFFLRLPLTYIEMQLHTQLDECYHVGKYYIAMRYHS